MTVCFTGHRNIAYEDALRLPTLLDRVLTDLIERGTISHSNKHVMDGRNMKMGGT